jgi:hypothetical protein
VGGWALWQMIAGILGPYVLATLGEADDPLPLAIAITVSFAVALVFAVMISCRIVRVLDGGSKQGLPGLLILLALVVVAFAAGYFLLARSGPTQVTGLHTRVDASCGRSCTRPRSSEPPETV